MTTCVTLRFVLPLFPISLLIHVRSVNPSLLLCSPHSSMVLLRVSRVLCSNSQISVLLLEFRLPLILWTSLHFVFLYLDYGISLHGSSLLISICLLPRLCLGRLLCNTQDIFLISTFYGVQVRSFLALFWWVYTWYKGKQCVFTCSERPRSMSGQRADHH